MTLQQGYFQKLNLKKQKHRTPLQYNVFCLCMYIYNLKKNVYNTDDFNRVKLLDETGMLEGSYINASHVFVSQNTLAFF